MQKMLIKRANHKRKPIRKAGQSQEEANQKNGFITKEGGGGGNHKMSISRAGQSLEGANPRKGANHRRGKVI
jgi:hypothetical protein